MLHIDTERTGRLLAFWMKEVMPILGASFNIACLKFHVWHKAPRPVGNMQADFIQADSMQADVDVDKFDAIIAETLPAGAAQAFHSIYFLSYGVADRTHAWWHVTGDGDERRSVIFSAVEMLERVRGTPCAADTL